MTKMRRPADTRPSVMRRSAQPPRDRVIADDRSGDQLRKHRDVDRDFEQAAVRLHLAAIHIDEIRDRMEGEERNAERQRDARQRESVAAERGIERADREVGVLEDAEQREIGRDAGRNCEPPPLSLRRADQQREAVIEHDLEGQQQHEARLAPGVEQQRRREQDDVLRRDAGRQAIEQKEQRQEVEQEGDRRKQHRRPVALTRADAWPSRRSGRSRRRAGAAQDRSAEIPARCARG